MKLEKPANNQLVKQIKKSEITYRVVAAVSFLLLFLGLISGELFFYFSSIIHFIVSSAYYLSRFLDKIRLEIREVKNK